MLVFQWNAVRVGDRVIVHDDLDSGLALHAGVVTLVQTHTQSPNEVTIRLDDRASLVRPRRHAVHLLPVDRRFSCWRCDATVAESSEEAGGRVAA